MINNGMFAAVHYTGKLAGGEIFDSSENGDPLEFEIGTESVIPEFEKQIVMMNIGEEKEFLVKAGDAYGEYSDTYIEKVPLSE
ncbi:MAG TPA: FKBP-type peptidyl-prolyl cis-trans isomerase [Spirochaetota bacterium]|nr:FKBP-type peptidyl-prolyl cis-trans isomerase [Spirochaetota bacterium]